MVRKHPLWWMQKVFYYQLSFMHIYRHFMTTLDSINCLKLSHSNRFWKSLQSSCQRWFILFLDTLVSPKLWAVSSVAPENILLSSARLLWFSYSSLTSPGDKGHVSSKQQVSTVYYTLPWHTTGTQILLQRVKKVRITLLLGWVDR